MIALLLLQASCTPVLAPVSDARPKAAPAVPVAAAPVAPPVPEALGPTAPVLSDGATWSPDGAVWARYRELARADQKHIYGRLVELCDGAGNRLAGSPGQKRAEAIGGKWLEADGLKVLRDPVKLPAWIRGEAELTMLSPRAESLPLLALGNSVGTPEGGVDAPVVVIRDFAELSPAVKGKIVLYNHPMVPGTPSIDHYGDAVAYRAGGASKAAAFGAVAVLVRSVTTRSLSTPHTGVLGYDDAQSRVAAAAITPEDADRIARLAGAGEVRLHLRITAHMEPDVDGLNVIGELRGSTWPDEIVVVGGHLDSWDVGQGAADDGAGIVESVEALRLVAKEGQPKRTIRVVLFANEENGLRGGKGYFAAHGTEHHVAAVESDLGGGGPRGWGFTASPEQRAWLEPMLKGAGMFVKEEGGGADISLLVNDGVLGIGLLPDDSHYFDVHHTAADTVDKIEPAALADSTGAIAALLDQLANAPAAPAKAPVRSK